MQKKLIQEMKLGKTLIRNFLTIRYNPEEKSIINKAVWKEFSDKNEDRNGVKTENLLLKSIKKSIPQEEKTIIVSLSSGIDSSLSLALLRKSFPRKKIVAICGVFEQDNDESKIAKKIAEKFETDFKIIQMESIFSNMPEIIYITRKPRWNTYNHIITKESKRYGKIIVTGDGADELFGGYVFRYNKFLNLLQKHDNWKQKVKKYLDCHNRDWVPDQDNLFGKAIKFDWEEIYQYFKIYFQNKLDPLKQVMLADFNGKLLFDFIPTARAIFNYYNVKGVPIYLDQDIIDFTKNLPLNQKFDKTTRKGKLILRKIAKRMKIGHIDEKKGFSPSLHVDWKKHGKDICQDYLLNKKSQVFEKQLINYEWIKKAFFKIENDGDVRYLNRVISILALEIWLRLFITKELNYKKRLV